MSTIPQAVLALIGSGPWSYPGQSAVEPHEAVYIKADEPAAPFTFAEVEELHHQGVFGNLLADVHDDWLTYRERLKATHDLHGPLAEAQVAKLPVDDRPMLEQIRAKYDGDKNGWRPRGENTR
jgi:hypothetical protein